MILLFIYFSLIHPIHFLYYIGKVQLDVIHVLLEVEVVIRLLCRDFFVLYMYKS